MHNADHHSLGEALSALASKLVPGILGSIVALRALPSDATLGQRLTSFVGGVSAAVYVAPALVTWTGASGDEVVYATIFLVGTFGMVVVGEVTTAIRDLQLAPIMRDTMRRIFRVDRG